MPLLRRRSFLDLLNSNADSEDLPRPNTTGLLRPDPSPSLRPVSEYGSASRLSHELQPEDVEDNPPSRNKRFSFFRNLSESHLATRPRDEYKSEDAPPLPSVQNGIGAVPAIVKTAPTMEDADLAEETERERKVRPSLFKRSMSRAKQSESGQPRKSIDEKRHERSKGSSLRWRRLQGRSTGLEDLARLSAAHIQQAQVAPPSYGDESNSALALPLPTPRYSESWQTDGSGSSGDQVYGSTTTTTHTVSTHTTFFKLPRRNKNRNSLFPLPVTLPPPDAQPSPSRSNGPATPRASTSAYSTTSLQAPDDGRSPPATVLQRRHTEASPTKQNSNQIQPPLPSPHAALARASLSFAEPGMNLFRNDSQISRNSSNTSPLQPPMRLGLRDRASTTSSFGRASHDIDTPPLPNGSGRNSTSTNGRSSLGGFLSFTRLRHGSGPDSPRHGSPGTRSKSNSFAISREVLVIPEREEGDTPGKYLERLEAAVARSMIAGILSKSADPFAQAVLRSYTRRFSFFTEPLDMSLRKFLLEAELPKETQQVDRVIQAFADRYHECNPGIFLTPDQAYIIAFSLMMLHTDAFNKNNKRKMQKHDYIKNTSGQHVADDILACFYDNICYTPFVHYEEEVDINGERVLPFQAKKKSKLKVAIAGDVNASKKPLSGPVDPYNLLVDQKLDLLRPAIKDSIALDDPYDYRGSQGDFDSNYLQRAFTHTGVLQIISARSRPTAYEGQLNHNNPNPVETQAGTIDLKITKVGTLWRKATKKKKARSPWQEWGAILTGSQLYLFKNAHWAKGLVHQFMLAQKHGQPRTPVIFKPPLHDFKPDALIKTDNSVALVDSGYTRHKHAFTFVRPGGMEEVLLADNESELNDWLALINYAAAFRAAGVRIRGMVGGNEEDLRKGDVARLSSTHSSRSVQTTNGEVTVRNGVLSPQLQRQVMAARRQIMVQKIAELEDEIAKANRQLDGMLRTARHLLVLAPIAPKSREETIHAAARTDAMVKWLRRDIWKMKCHRDVLAMDAQQDGVSASELQSMTTAEQQKEAASASEAKKEQPTISLARYGSRTSAARSPPQSPTAASARTNRFSAAGSINTFMDNDVFRTPPESALQQNGEGWGLPPLHLDTQGNGRHRTSVSSTLLTASSPRRASLSHASSASSVRQVAERQHPATSAGRVTPVSSQESKEVEFLARTTTATESVAPGAARGLSVDGTPLDLSIATPDSKQSKGVRRSLQKTLRDGHHHHHHGSHQKHRRGKESDGTIRSGGAGADAEETQEGTPGLAREKGRFILHGKQASVIHFGNDWADERMKLRREKWRQNSNSPRDDEAHDVWRESYATAPDDGRRSSVASPVIREMSDTEGTLSEDESAPRSNSAHSHGFREDAEAAEAFAASAGIGVVSSDSSNQGDAASYFDASNGDARPRRRQTVIGPTRKSNGNYQQAEEAEEDTDEEDFSLGPRGNRRTVIGPSTQVQEGEAFHKSHLSQSSVSAGAEQEMEDDSLIEAAIDDAELRHLSQAVVS